MSKALLELPALVLATARIGGRTPIDDVDAALHNVDRMTDLVRSIGFPTIALDAARTALQRLRSGDRPEVELIIDAMMDLNSPALHNALRKASRVAA